jgi:hypothetical protein
MILYSLTLIAAVGLATSSAGSVGEDDIRISQGVAKEHLDDVTVKLLDVRQPAAWEDSDSKIKGAERKDPQDLDSWAADYSSEDALFLYCS